MRAPAGVGAVAGALWLSALLVGPVEAQPAGIEEETGTESETETGTETETESETETETEIESSPNTDFRSADERARMLFEEGERAYDEGRYEDAIAAFRESYELSGRPLLLFNLANVYERTGAYRSTIDALTQYAESALGPERLVVERRIEALRSRVEQRDEREGRILEPVISPLIPLGYVLLASGTALVAAGLVVGGLALAERSSAAEACVSRDGLLLCPREAESAIDDEQNLSLLADLTAGLGIAALATGVVFLMVGHEQSEAPRIGLGLRSVNVRGRF